MNLRDLQNATTPVTLIEGDTPETSLIANVYRSKRTRTNREKLRVALKESADMIVKAQKDVQKLLKDGDAMDNRVQLADAQRALYAIEGDESRADEAAKLRETIAELESSQEKSLPRVLALQQKMLDLETDTTEAMHDLLARQMAFFVADTNLRETPDADAPLVPPTVEFWRDQFDSVTLQTFNAKVLETLDGPLSMRASMPA